MRPSSKKAPDDSRRIPSPDVTPGNADATIREFCAEVRCAPATAWRLINSGHVKAYRFDRRIKITRASIDMLKQRGRFEPRAAARDDA